MILRFLMPGDIVRRVNGHEVFTLEDLKAHFVPDELNKDAPGGAESDAQAPEAATGTVHQITQRGSQRHLADSFQQFVFRRDALKEQFRKDQTSSNAWP